MTEYIEIFDNKVLIFFGENLVLLKKKYLSNVFKDNEEDKESKRSMRNVMKPNNKIEKMNEMNQSNEKDLVT